MNNWCGIFIDRDLSFCVLESLISIEILAWNSVLPTFYHFFRGAMAAVVVLWPRVCAHGFGNNFFSFFTSFFLLLSSLFLFLSSAVQIFYFFQFPMSCFPILVTTIIKKFSLELLKRLFGRIWNNDYGKWAEQWTNSVQHRIPFLYGNGTNRTMVRMKLCVYVYVYVCMCGTY